MTTLVLVMLVGGMAGLGLVLLVSMFERGSVTGAAGLAQIDAARQRGRRQASLTADRRHGESARIAGSARAARRAPGARGDLPPSVRADLGMTGQSVETFLAQCLLGAFLGLFLPFLVLGPMALVGGISLVVPLWLTVFGAALGALMPYSQIRRRAEARRRDFRHVVSSFLDLVAMNLAGGRGVPEALQTATSVSDGWAMVRIGTPSRRPGSGTTLDPLGALGDGSTSTSCATWRGPGAGRGGPRRCATRSPPAPAPCAARSSPTRRGRAAARSQSMLVAQLLLCVGFLLFLTAPCCCKSPRDVTEDECGDHHRVATERLFVACRT